MSWTRQERDEFLDFTTFPPDEKPKRFASPHSNRPLGYIVNVSSTQESLLNAAPTRKQTSPVTPTKIPWTPTKVPKTIPEATADLSPATLTYTPSTASSPSSPTYPISDTPPLAQSPPPFHPWTPPKRGLSILLPYSPTDEYADEDVPFPVTPPFRPRQLFPVESSVSKTPSPQKRSQWVTDLALFEPSAATPEPEDDIEEIEPTHVLGEEQRVTSSQTDVKQSHTKKGTKRRLSLLLSPSPPSGSRRRERRKCCVIL